MNASPALSTPWSRRWNIGTLVHRIIVLPGQRVALLSDEGLSIHGLADDTASLHRDGVHEAARWSDRLVLLEDSETLNVLDPGTGQTIGSPIPLGDDPDALSLTLAVSADGLTATAGDDRPITVHLLGGCAVRWDRHEDRHGGLLARDATKIALDVRSRRTTQPGGHQGDRSRFHITADPPTSGELLAAWEDPSEGTTALAFLPDGRLVSGGDDGRIRVWEPRTGAPLPGPLFGMVGGQLMGHSDAVEHLAPFQAKDGTWRLAAADGEHTVRVWDLETGHQIGDAITAHTSVIRALLADGSRLISVDTDGNVVVLDDDGTVSGTHDLGVTVWGAALVEGELAVGLSDGWGTVELP